MMAFVLLSLTLSLLTLTQTITEVESFPVPSSSSHTSVILSTSTSPAYYAKRSINYHLLAQTNDDDDNDNDKDDEIVDYSSSLASGVIDFDWKAIASHVFDVDAAVDTTNLFQPQVNDQEGDQTKTNETPQHMHSKPIILFDGVCNLCNGGVNFAIDHDKTGKFRFASLQSNVAKSLLLRDGKDPFTTSDVVLVTPEKTYYSSEAVAKIMAGLDMRVLKFLGIAGQITPSFARNLIYRVVSGNRFILGENDSCRMDFDGEYTSRFVSDPPPQSLCSATKEENE